MNADRKPGPAWPRINAKHASAQSAAT